MRCEMRRAIRVVIVDALYIVIKVVFIAGYICIAIR